MIDRPVALLRRERGVSPVISTILMVAIVVILAATISVMVLGFSEDLQNPAPVVGQSSGELEPVDGGDGGIITVTHLSGDSVEVENIEIVVDATDACGKRTRVVNLPASFSRQSYPTSQFNSENFEGDDLLAEGAIPWFGQEEWNAKLLMDTADNTFNAGDSFQLRLASGRCDLEKGERVKIDIIHIPSNTIIISEEFTA
jgi:flagellin-like protein